MVQEIRIARLPIVHSQHRTEPGRGPLPSSAPAPAGAPVQDMSRDGLGAGGVQATNGGVAGSRPTQAGYRPLPSVAGRRLDHGNRHETSDAGTLVREGEPVDVDEVGRLPAG